MQPNQQHNRQLPLANKYNDMILRAEMKAREQIMNEQALAKPQEPEQKGKPTWTPIGKGKHQALTIPQLVFKDPDYFFWAYEDGVFTGTLADEAEIVYQRATNIKLPESTVADYCVHPSTGKFVYMEIHRSGRGNHADTIIEKTRTVIDMSIPRQICPYDKRGSRLMVDAVKYYVFGGTRVRMTKARCQEFFEASENFDL